MPEGVREHSCDVHTSGVEASPQPYLISPTSFPTAKGACLSFFARHQNWCTQSIHTLLREGLCQCNLPFFFWVPSQNTDDKLIASLSFLTYSGETFLQLGCQDWLLPVSSFQWEQVTYDVYRCVYERNWVPYPPTLSWFNFLNLEYSLIVMFYFSYKETYTLNKSIKEEIAIWTSLYYSCFCRL